jgi:hypothetical protein
MNPISALEKLINEHGSAAILKQQLDFARDQYSSMERTVEEWRSKAAKFEAQLEIEREAHSAARDALKTLKSEHEEEVRIHKLVEFRRGKRTGGVWQPFCPKCHSPVACTLEQKFFAHCTSSCGWGAVIENNIKLLASQIGG